MSTAHLVPRQPDAAPAVYDAATLAVLAAMEEAAEKHLDAIRPNNTKRGYANDWALWEEFHDWLAERTGQRLPSTAVTKGTLVGFVVWLDTIKLAAPNSIDRRITGVTVTARNEHGIDTGLIRGLLCRSCNGREPHDDGLFRKYRERPPAQILGIHLRYYDPWHGWAQPRAIDPNQLDNHPAYALAAKLGERLQQERAED